MPEFYLRQTHYIKVVAANAVEAQTIGVKIKEDFIEMLLDLGFEIADEPDLQKTWELVSQQRWQQDNLPY